jgi:hypothetical protein
MIKRTLFSLFTGILFGVLLVASPSVRAESPCSGFCSEHTIKEGCVSDYAGCAMYYNAQGQLEDVICFYVNTCPPQNN